VIRAGALAVVAAVLFGVLFFRLWALQVLRSEAFAQQALRNDVKEITVPAPRGRIKDADGRIMVDNTIGVMAQVNPASLERSVDCADYSGTEATQCQAAMAQLPVGAAPRCVAFPAQHRCEELVRLSRIFDLKPKVLWRSYERPLISGGDGEPEYVVNAGPPINLAPATEARSPTSWSAVPASPASSSCAPTSVSTGSTRRRWPRPCSARPAGSTPSR